MRGQIENNFGKTTGQLRQFQVKSSLHISPAPASLDLERFVHGHLHGGHHAVAGRGEGTDAAPIRVEPHDLHDRAKAWLPYMGLPNLTSTMLAWLGVIKGRRVLELGTGSGFLAAALAHRGAEVHAVDISPRSIEVARRRSETSGVADRITFAVMPCETLDLPDQYFDAACGIFVLHHTDIARVSAEIRRVLRPAARAAFIETMAFNPVLMWARANLVGHHGIEKASSDDEAPLGPAQIEILTRDFGGKANLAFPEFVCFRMLSYVPLLQSRPASLLLAEADRFGRMIPGLAGKSYYGVVRLENP